MQTTSCGVTNSKTEQVIINARPKEQLPWAQSSYNVMYVGWGPKANKLLLYLCSKMLPMVTEGKGTEWHGCQVVACGRQEWGWSMADRNKLGQ